MFPNFPLLICLTEHHLQAQEVGFISLDSYTIGANYCRTNSQGGGSMIYVLNGLKFTNVDLKDLCKEKDIEVCAVKINVNSKIMCVITLYRAPSGDFAYILLRLDNVLKFLFSSSTCLILCGDLNVNYLGENDHKSQLNNLLLMYNLKGIIDFPMRISHSTASAMDNFIIDTSPFHDYSVNPLTNDLSDHDAQILTLKIPPLKQRERIKLIRKKLMYLRLTILFTN